MNNSGAMRGGHALPDLHCEIEQLARAVGWRQGRAFYKFHHEVVRPDIVQVADVRMIQGRNRPCLALEAFRKRLIRDLSG